MIYTYIYKYIYIYIYIHIHIYIHSYINSSPVMLTSLKSNKSEITKFGPKKGKTFLRSHHLKTNFSISKKYIEWIIPLPVFYIS